MKDAPILLLNQATSALDNHSQWLVREAILTTSRARSSVLTDHRLSTMVPAKFLRDVA